MPWGQERLASIRETGGQAEVIALDVADRAAVFDAAATIDRIHGRIDMLFANAGTNLTPRNWSDAVDDPSVLDGWDTVIDANLKGVYNGVTAVLPAMREAKSGLIINTSSLVGQISPPFFSTYSATKHALEGYVQGLRYEVSPFGIDVAIVQPGPFGTGLLAGGQAPARADVLAGYGDLAGVPNAMGQHFAAFLQSDEAPKPQLVVDAYLALAEMRRVLRPGGRFLCLEFSRPTQPWLDPVYDTYSFKVLPWLGRVVAKDAAAYQYLAESIRRFPDQQDLAERMRRAGFAKVTWRNLSAGIAAIHSGWRY